MLALKYMLVRGMIRQVVVLSPRLWCPWVGAWLRLWVKVQLYFHWGTWSWTDDRTCLFTLQSGLQTERLLSSEAILARTSLWATISVTARPILLGAFGPRLALDHWFKQCFLVCTRPHPLKFIMLLKLLLDYLVGLIWTELWAPFANLKGTNRARSRPFSWITLVLLSCFFGILSDT